MVTVSSNQSTLDSHRLSSNARDGIDACIRTFVPLGLTVTLASILIGMAVSPAAAFVTATVGLCPAIATMYFAAWTGDRSVIETAAEVVFTDVRKAAAAGAPVLAILPVGAAIGLPTIAIVFGVIGGSGAAVVSFAVWSFPERPDDVPIVPESVSTQPSTQVEPVTAD